MKTYALVAMLALASLVTACAAKGPLAKAQVGALTVGEAALQVADIEHSLYAAKLYDQAAHDAMLEREIALVRAARGYERAVAAWPANTPAPAAVLAAQSGLEAALADFSKVVPAAASVHAPLEAALAGLRAYLATRSSEQNLPRPMQSQEIPAGGVIALIGVAESLIEAYRRLRGQLVKADVSPEQLAALDARLTAEESDLEAELAKDKAADPTA